MMCLIYEEGDWMLYAVFGFLLVLSIIRHVYKKIRHRIKYPIRSANPPRKIMSSGDAVLLNGRKYTYISFMDTNMSYAFQDEDSVDYRYFKPEEFYAKVESISDEHGVKWERSR